MPVRWVGHLLLRSKQRNRQQSFEPNDLSDLSALAVATVHCDVVVTERQWAARIHDSGAARLHATTAIAKLGELPALLPQ